MINLRDIDKCYRSAVQELRVLKAINLEINEGAMVAIMGLLSGYGKSTLLDIIGLLDGYDRGHYELNGTPIRKLGESRAGLLRRCILLPTLNSNLA